MKLEKLKAVFKGERISLFSVSHTHTHTWNTLNYIHVSLQCLHWLAGLYLEYELTSIWYVNNPCFFSHMRSHSVISGLKITTNQLNMAFSFIYFFYFGNRFSFPRPQFWNSTLTLNELTNLFDQESHKFTFENGPSQVYYVSLLLFL